MTSLPLHSPAELLLLLHPQHTPGLRQLLRVTFLDLLRQQVLAVSTEQTRPHPRDPMTEQQYVTGGAALTAYQPLPHEKLLVDAFRVDEQLRIPFRQYVRMVFQNTQTASAYYKLVEANPRTGQQFSQHWFRQLIGYRGLTPAGQQLRSMTEAEISQLDKAFVAQADRNPVAAHQFMQQLGGALFLLPSYTSEVGRQLEQELRRVPEPAHDTTGDFGASINGDTCWHTHADTFDSHCDSDSSSSSDGGESSSGDSGCGGDSGCSGGGGCGGD